MNRQQKRKISSSRFLLGLLGLVLFLGLWIFLTQWPRTLVDTQGNPRQVSGFFVNDEGRSIVPSPLDIPVALLRELQTPGPNSGLPMLLEKSLQSLGHYFLGLILGLSLGILVGIITATVPFFEPVQSWVARLIRPIPPLAWIPFAIIWFGITPFTAAFILSIGVFWINYFAVIGSFGQLDPGLMEVAMVTGHGGYFAALFQLRLPAALPGILTGIRSSLGMGWMTLVAAELTGVPGLGQRMFTASGLLAVDTVLVYMLVIALFYGITDASFALIQRRLLQWQAS